MISRPAFGLTMMVAACVTAPVQAWTHDLVIARGGHSSAVILVARDAGPLETRAAADLRKYIGLIAGAGPDLFVDTPPSLKQAMIVIGKAAIAADPPLAAQLAKP